MTNILCGAKPRLWMLSIAAAAFNGAMAIFCPAQQDYSAVVAFGDSLSDYGNNGVFTTTATSKPASSIEGTWVIQLAGEIQLPLTASDEGGTDYARGGAITSGLLRQVNTYLKKNQRASPSILYTFFAGSNDIIDYLSNTRPIDVADLLTTASVAANNVKSRIIQIYNAGGRNFVWLNMFPLDRTPGGIKSGSSAYLAQAVNQFNLTYDAAVQSLEEQYPDIVLTRVDFHAISNDIIDYPAKYSIANAAASSKGKSVNPDTYLFWDDLHPTTRGHQILASSVFTQIIQLTSHGETRAAKKIVAQLSRAAGARH